MISKAKQGLDGCAFEVVFQGELKNLPKQPLINEHGKKYGTVEAKDGKATVRLVLPRFIRDDNIQPFSIVDSIMLEMIKSDCEKQLKQLFGSELNSTIKTIECNVTQKVSGNATQSDVLNLLNLSTLSTERDNIKYVGPSRYCSLKEETHTVIAKRLHYYIIKAYDKTQQQIMEKKEKKQNSDAVPDGLLRIEIIMIERTLEKLFGGKTTFADILCKDALVSIIKEYQRIFCDEIIKEKIKPYLNKCTLLLIESLCETENIVKTIAKQRDLIVDAEVLKKSVRKWNVLRGRSDHLARDYQNIIDKYALPQDIIETFSEFKKSCG
ncbi:hypothetical protein [Acetobacterium sp.]|uniref:hypothetical protein n=1 Tax=Acetobacterium sp. TaxID=1872094 RepID=UPI002F409330